MGIRFRKRIKLLPGVHINLSRSGVSTSLGVRGASITKGHGQTRTNLGIPGSGISHNTVTVDAPVQRGGFETTFNILGKMLMFIATIGLVFVAALFSPRKRRR